MAVSPLETGPKAAGFVEALGAFGRLHRAQRWEGTFVRVPDHHTAGYRPAALARSSHEYIWDMLRWYGRDARAATTRARELFKRELFGVDEPLAAWWITSRPRPRARTSGVGCCCCSGRPRAVNRHSRSC